ncbi:unnamed protein product [Echinostoma caproni]|uniref:Uncharacterized protein n=1 Tax=Echinostoma caproni TaxID=27848 RepID=A0A183BBS3_9TREM|nr:unnamed protein product [Echinostoma caproni]
MTFSANKINLLSSRCQVPPGSLTRNGIPPGIYYRRPANESFQKYQIVSAALASPPPSTVQGCSGHLSGQIDRLRRTRNALGFGPTDRRP